MIKVNNEKVVIGRFPDGTLNIKGDASLTDGTVLITWNYEDDGEFLALSFLTKFYQAYGNEVVLFLPYVPNARMDRVEKANDVFTMKYFGEMINSLNFSKVYVMDVHSSVAGAVIRNCYFLSSDNIFLDVVRMVANKEQELPIIFYPDEGSMKRYRKLKDIPYGFGVKERKWETGEILGLKMIGINPEDVAGKNVIIRDDICSKGGTFYYSAKMLKEVGAKNVYLFVTHCENSVLNGEFGEDKKALLDTGLIEHMFTTDSIYTKPIAERMSVVSIGVSYDDEPEECGCGCGHCEGGCHHEE